MNIFCLYKEPEKMKTLKPYYWFILLCFRKHTNIKLIKPAQKGHFYNNSNNRCKSFCYQHKHLLNFKFLSPYYIRLFKTIVYCTILNALSTDSLAVNGASMKKEKQGLKMYGILPSL